MNSLTPMEAFQIEEPSGAAESWQSLILFNELDVDKDGKIPTQELLDRMQTNAARFVRSQSLEIAKNSRYGITAAQIRSLVKWADKNNDNWINFSEFCLLMAQIKQLRGRYAMLRAVQFVIPTGQREEQFSYIEQYTCVPPPLFMILVSLIEIGFYIYYAVTDETDPGLSVTGPVPIDSWAIYSPVKKEEAWRFLTYMLIHIGIYHIAFNCLTQIILGVPLELVHKPHRICAVYMAGVIYGSLAVSIVDPYVYLAGASGGVYALMAGHVANLVVNWAEMEFAVVRVIVMTMIIGADVGLTIYNRFANPGGAAGRHASKLRKLRPTKHTSQPCVGHRKMAAILNVSYAAHAAGFLAGLFMGVLVLRNFKLHTWERVVWWICLVAFVTIFLAMIVYNVVPSDAWV